MDVGTLSLMVSWIVLVFIANLIVPIPRNIGFEGFAVLYIVYTAVIILLGFFIYWMLFQRGNMETKSPWNEYGEAKIQELEYELTQLATIVRNQQTAIDKMTKILGKFVRVFENLSSAAAAEEDDRK